MSWADYRHRCDALFSACWDCPRPCAVCREWARATAFGHEPSPDFAEACEDTYRAVTTMRERGVNILIGVPSR